MHNRIIFKQLLKYLARPQIKVITGLGRVGKSTALKYLLSQIEHSNKTYIDLEKIENRVLFSENAYATI